MVIDSHVHFWNYDAKRDAWMDAMPVLQKDHLPLELKNIMADNKVEGCIAVQAGQSENETIFLENLANKNSWIKGIVGWINLSGNDIEERLEYFSAFRSIKGWRHIVQAEPEGFLLRKDFTNGIRALKKYNYTYDILVQHQQLKETLQFVAAFPDQSFVIDHCAKPNIVAAEIKDWAADIKELALYPNVYCKLSGLLTEAKWHDWQAGDIYLYFDVIFENFGCNRIMFGSDWPVLNVAGSYSIWKGLLADYLSRFTTGQQQQFWGENAARFYSL